MNGTLLMSSASRRIELAYRTVVKHRFIQHIQTFELKNVTHCVCHK